MSVILDTSFLIAFNNAKDENHKSAQSLKAKLKEKEFGQCYISDYIFDEFVTFLRAKLFPESSIKEIGDALLADQSIKLLKIDVDTFLKSWEFFKRSNELSFTDCSTITLAKELGIRNVATFDSDFDKITFIRRI